MELTNLLIESLPLVAVGLFAGFASGLIGIGGGMFYIIVYTYFIEQQLGISNESELVRMVISNSILSTCFAAFSASYKQYKLNNFFIKPVLFIGIPGVIGSIGLSFVLSKVTWYNRDVFAIVFTILMIPLIWKMMSKTKAGNTEVKDISLGRLILIGLFSGSATALSGLGGSVLLTPILNGFLRVNIQKVVSIAVGVITVVALGTTVFNLLYQTYSTDISSLPYTISGINFLMVLPVALGILITAPLGVKVSKKLPEKTIKIIFIVFCFLIIIRNVFELIY